MEVQENGAGELDHETILTGSLRNKGYLQILTGNFEGARDSLNRAWEIDKFDYLLPLNLGHTYLLTNDEHEASYYYNRAIELLNPDDFIESKNVIISDFDLFIDEGWNVQLCEKYKQWFIDRLRKDHS